MLLATISATCIIVVMTQKLHWVSFDVKRCVSGSERAEAVDLVCTCLALPEHGSDSFRRHIHFIPPS
ncbi:hypothetical protein PILCRDRAFT_830384 [Piloderma croceum F 1598]|uniref:Secreted protein n=1 Tax=Piloderma croceum (strain F 1598) TaxID=765440 RepID=A0A0C3ETF4_PILCF|nr:hypothetical protein PILCRDRAFT_830384 [Piloderma croceum F 1598]